MSNKHKYSLVERPYFRQF